MGKLVIGCYSYKSSEKYGTKYTNVITDVRTQVDALDKKRKSTASLETANAFDAIFVAPEYLFTAENSTKERKPLSAQHKEDVIRDLKAISNDFKKILIFPGTIFYQEALSTDIAFDKMRANLVAAAFTIGAKKNIGGDARDASDATTGWKAGSVNVPGTKDIAQKADRNSFRAYNSMYGFLDGDSIMKPYNKQWDFKETEGVDPSQLAYVPGSSSSTEEIHKFLFGFEICFDHGQGALKGKNVDVDFQIVVSDSVSTKPENMKLAAGGYFIHASSNHNQTSVYRPGPQKVGVTSGATKKNQMAYWVVDVASRPDVVVATTPVTQVAAAGGLKVGGKVIPGAVKLPGMTK